MARLAFLLACAAFHLAITRSEQATSYKLQLSGGGPQIFPGGAFKPANTDNFPASKHLSGAIVALNPNALRAPHWHIPAEWGFVVDGVCRVAAVEQGANLTASSLEYQPGDVWYFGSNVAHSVMGVDPDGCSYVSVWNNGTFNEHTQSMELSTWVALLPPAILSQLTNTSTSVLTGGLPYLTPANTTSTNQLRNSTVDIFLPQGADSADLDVNSTVPVTAPQESPRYGLKAAKPQMNVDNVGSFVFEDASLFPAAKDMWGGVLHLEPGAMRSSHWHLGSDEWQYVVNGTNIEVGNYVGNGTLAVASLGTGDVGVSPQGAPHYVKNNGKLAADILLVFTGAADSGIDLAGVLGSFPAQWVAATLNTTADFAKGLALNAEPSLAGFVAPPATSQIL